MPITKGALALGSTIIGGGGGGDISNIEDLIIDCSKGRIICDTSTMTVGDKIRVRSITNPSHTEDKTVATVGTDLVFKVYPYERYKICTVQTINDTPTEIGGVYKTVDYGQTLFINVLDKTTLGGIQGILNAHQETQLLNIGDEVTVKQGNDDWVMQIGHIDGTNRYIEFVSKYASDTSYAVGTSYNLRTNLLNYLGTFYDNLADNEKIYIKTKTCKYNESGLRTIDQKIWIPSRNEVFGNQSGEDNTWFSIFATQSARAKSKYSGGGCSWQLTSRNTQYNGYTDYVDKNGALQYTNDSDLSALPCFRLTADS